MVLEPGEKVHVIKARAFDTDLRRHFIGEVITATDYAVRLKGYAFILNAGTNQWIRLPELRTRILSLLDASVIVNVLPPNAMIDKAIYTIGDDKHLCVTDGETFALDINEFGIKQ